MRAGSIVGSGTVSNKDWSKGWSCIAEKRAIETIEHGEPKTGFMQFGDVDPHRDEARQPLACSARSSSRCWSASERARRCWRVAGARCALRRRGARAAAVVASRATPRRRPSPPTSRCPPDAAAPTPDEAAAGMRDAVDSGLLWKATKDGRTRLPVRHDPRRQAVAGCFPARDVLQARCRPATSSRWSST